MNKELKTKEYIQKVDSLKLSQSSRARIEKNLLEYARFHSVRVGEDGRSIEQVSSQNTWRTSLFNLFKQPKSMTAAIVAIALIAGGGTSYAAEGAVPGDFLYTVKTEVNENLKSVFAIGVNAEAELQADLLEERVEEAQKLHASGKLSGDTAATVSKNIENQAKLTADAAAKSETTVAAKTNTRVQVALQNLLALGDLDASLASEVTATLNASTISTGTYAISAYLDDMKVRVNTLRSVIEEHKSELKASVYAELSVKIEAAAQLVVEASTKIEDEARVLLDKAATLIGEVEAKLSTIGQAKVDVDTGIITDIDFSIDPMKIDIRAGSEGTSSVDSGTEESEQTETSTDTETQIELEVDAATDTSVDAGVIDAGVETDTSIRSGLSI